MQLYLKDKKRNNLYTVQKYAHLLVLGHYLFLKPHIFFQALLLENCLHLKQVVSEDKYIHAYFCTKGRLLFAYLQHYVEGLDS